MQSKTGFDERFVMSRRTHNMPITALWTLIVSLAVLAFGLTLKLAEYKRLLRDEIKSLNAARSELANGKQDHDKAIIEIKKECQKKIDELTEINAQLEKQINQQNPPSENWGSEFNKI